MQERFEMTRIFVFLAIAAMALTGCQKRLVHSAEEFPDDIADSQDQALNEFLAELNLRLQARTLSCYYLCAARLMRRDVAGATMSLEELLSLRSHAEVGRWAGWYNGDRKANMPAILQRLRSIQIHCKTAALDASPLKKPNG